MVLDGELSTSVPSLENCIFEQVIFDRIYLVVTLTFDFINSKSDQLLFVSNCA